MTMEPRLQHRIQVGGAYVSVMEAGYTDEAATPVLLLHGNPDTHHVWMPVLDHLTDAHARFLLPDMPGYGPCPPPPPSFTYCADSTVPMWDAVLDELQVETPIVIVVHDFGGPWLLPWVARNPDRVRGVLLTNTLLHPSYSWHFWARVWQTPVLGELAGWLNHPVLFRRELRRGGPLLPEDWADATFRRITPAMHRSMLRTYRAHARPHEVWAQEYERFCAVRHRFPCKTVWGCRDPFLPRSLADSFGPDTHLLDDAGHWPPVEAPEQVAQALRSLLTPSPS